MGADEIRWLYCRHNPANNINFGPGPAEELRSKFLLKLWNTYAFLCNYARIDGFDPNAPRVAVEDRPDIDRWILSDLQYLIETAREEYENFNVPAFCVQAERFVDDLLSNWYVRRNRRRFWKSEQGPDKLAAYQTLHAVLVTLTKLLAPIMPFLSETMYQNLTVKSGLRNSAVPRSVHLCDFPTPDETLIDTELSEDMTALLRLVSMGMAARNDARIKLRQPLAEVKIQPGHESDRRAVERFDDQIREELNVKKVTLHDPAHGPLIQHGVSLNMKSAGPKFGPRVQQVQAALNAANPEYVVAAFNALKPIELSCADDDVTLERADVRPYLILPEGWAGVADAGTQVLIDIRITESLKLEGLAREIVRHVQELRKTAGLQMEDRIELSLQTESAALRKAIETHREYICRETLAVKFTTEPLGDGAHRADVKVEGQALRIELRKA
jgi:isoleucyl-tRNA synthetase